MAVSLPINYAQCAPARDGLVVFAAYGFDPSLRLESNIGLLIPTCLPRVNILVDEL